MALPSAQRFQVSVRLEFGAIFQPTVRLPRILYLRRTTEPSGRRLHSSILLSLDSERLALPCAPRFQVSVRLEFAAIFQPRVRLPLILTMQRKAEPCATHLNSV